LSTRRPPTVALPRLRASATARSQHASITDGSPFESLAARRTARRENRGERPGPPSPASPPCDTHRRRSIRRPTCLASRRRPARSEPSSRITDPSVYCAPVPQRDALILMSAPQPPSMLQFGFTHQTRA
jgi:hypothetical protein